ncbi:hypothetical protein GCM10007416_09490 [Kroppenstedtia guangzhouensis]|uniref:Helicase XPB/Ssl2 N-terminal domain-containing protein n=1 Tax=Kroppenstedtia guangzhouensis TaxID=1274356 RepID=A0ABQ1G870_9BACL|nr:hypothetical protein [Kroppenstedtia guangzhouensis]GGA38647.1 hypothetical protein GCM10007416_09490 [Kroppenstedtia guangzhouensis]
MNFADLLTYADIDHLKRMASHYGCGRESHSKNGLITSLLYHLGGSSRLQGELDSLTPAQFRFLQQLCFDSRQLFSREDLLSKGRAAIDDEEETPRDLLIIGLRKGWVFPDVTGRNRTLFEVPEDLRQRYLRLFAQMYRGQKEVSEPAVYRNEEGLLAEDLHSFLLFLAQQEVRLTREGAIYRQQQRQILKTLHVEEEPVEGKGWRFGFGRRYHQYPDRFSLLYDYAYYKGYILEEETEGVLRLSALGLGKIHNNDGDEGREMYRFWLRLYRKPIPRIALIVKWIDLLAEGGWYLSREVEKVVGDWLDSYYYETGEDLFKRTLKLMLHLGLIRIGETPSGEQVVRMNVTGHRWVSGVSGFADKELDVKYLEVQSRR